MLGVQRSANRLLVVALIAAFSSPPVAVAARKDRRINVGALLDDVAPDRLVERVDKGIRDETLAFWRSQVDAHQRLARGVPSERLYAHPLLDAELTRIATALVPIEVRDRVRLRFHVVLEPIPVVAAMADGHVFLSTGAVAAADDESQLAYLAARALTQVLLNHHLIDSIARLEDVDKEARRSTLAQMPIEPEPFRLLESSLGDESEKQADHGALELMLLRDYSPDRAREFVVELLRLVKLTRLTAHAGPTFDAKRLPEREERLAQYIDGALADVMAERRAADDFVHPDARLRRMFAEVKRDNGSLAFDHGLYAIARANLEEAIATLGEDPLALNALGRLMRATAHSPYERGQATQKLQRAAELDGMHGRYPTVHRDYAVDLLTSDAPNATAVSARELRIYVELYRRDNSDRFPPDIAFVNDTLTAVERSRQ